MIEAGYSFTQHGVNALLEELYQLPQFELKAEADYMRSNFREWMTTRFELKPSQLHYLENMNEQTANLTATACSFALANNLPIYVEKPANSGKDEEEPVFKGIQAKTNLRAKSGSDGSAGVGGHVTISIAYQQ